MGIGTTVTVGFINEQGEWTAVSAANPLPVPASAFPTPEPPVDTLYSVYGDAASPGEWTWGLDGTPYIVTGRGFRCSAAGATVAGGRVWIPEEAAGAMPTEATVYLFGPNASIDTTPVQTKVISLVGATPGSWADAEFDNGQSMNPDDVWMIGVRFTGAEDGGKYAFGQGCRVGSGPVASNGDLGNDLAWIEYGPRTSQYRIGTAGAQDSQSDDHGYGVDILVKQVIITEPLIDPATPSGAQPEGHSGYTLMFSDEFQDGSLNTDKWDPWYPDTTFWNTTTPGGHRTNTDEPQGYDASGITFDEDGMVLTFREDNAAVPELAYTSGMVTSYPSFNPLYGYFEARMQLPNANDAWPAFWMMPTAQVRYAEYDIMENDGKDEFNTQTYHSFHRPGTGEISSDVHHYTEDVGNDYHTFGFLWEPTRLRWYVDGELVKDLTVVGSENNQPMYMICNLAGKKDSSPVAPFSAKVSHIRAWALPS